MPPVAIARTDWTDRLFKWWGATFLSLIALSFLFFMISSLVYRSGYMRIITNSAWSTAAQLPWYQAGMVITADLAMDVLAFPLCYAVFFVPTLFLVGAVIPDATGKPVVVKVLMYVVLFGVPLAALVLAVMWLNHSL